MDGEWMVNFKPSDLKMIAVRFSIQAIQLPLRYAWALSRNTSYDKTNFIIKAESQGFEGLGEVAPNVRYAETPERVELEFHRWNLITPHEFVVESWAKIMSQSPVCNALQMGLDMAFQKLLAVIKGQSLAKYLDLPEPKPRPICYTIPVMEPSEIEGFIEREDLNRFCWLKVKVNQNLALPMLNRILELVPQPLAIDGNEAWTSPEAVVNFVNELPKDRILFLEQPMPAAQKSDYAILKSQSSIPIWGDESVLMHPEPEFWVSAFAGINVKLMKAGSFANALSLLRTAKSLGLQTMLGCMVETTVGISTALALESLADYLDMDGFLVLEDEPFGLVKEENGSVYQP